MSILLLKQIQNPNKIGFLGFEYEFRPNYFGFWALGLGFGCDLRPKPKTQFFWVPLSAIE